MSIKRLLNKTVQNLNSKKHFFVQYLRKTRFKDVLRLNCLWHENCSIYQHIANQLGEPSSLEKIRGDATGFPIAQLLHRSIYQSETLRARRTIMNRWGYLLFILACLSQIELRRASNGAGVCPNRSLSIGKGDSPRRNFLAPRKSGHSENCDSRLWTNAKHRNSCSR